MKQVRRINCARNFCTLNMLNILRGPGIEGLLQFFVRRAKSILDQGGILHDCYHVLARFEPQAAPETTENRRKMSEVQLQQLALPGIQVRVGAQCGSFDS